jgi:hypothetical protein
VLADHDFHPDEPTVRIFRTPPAGVLRLDDSVAISQADHDGIVLRHYAFAGHWFKVNITTDRGGRLTETGDPACRFAVNCDIATPMERDGDSTFAVDLFTDVLVRQDGTSYVVTGRDEFGEMLGRGVISAAEGRGAERGLRDLVELIEAGGCWDGSATWPRPGRASLPGPGRCSAPGSPLACCPVPGGPGDRDGQGRSAGALPGCPAGSGAMRTHSASAAALSAASDLASVTRSATRGSATM